MIKTLDISAVLLICINVVQMVFIFFLLLPIIEITALSKCLKQYREVVKDSVVLKTIAVIYIIIVGGYGILYPTRTFNRLTIPKILKYTECPEGKLRSVIDATNATRNYLLAGFSLFFVLIIWRLYDYITFSAKLHEFSNLMGNYNLVDITCTTESDKEIDDSVLFDEIIEDEDSVHWPSVVNLNQIEHTRIQSFFKETPKKTDITHDNIETKAQSHSINIQNEVEDTQHSKSTHSDKAHGENSK